MLIKSIHGRKKERLSVSSKPTTSSRLWLFGLLLVCWGWVGVGCSGDTPANETESAVNSEATAGEESPSNESAIAPGEPTKPTEDPVSEAQKPEVPPEEPKVKPPKAPHPNATHVVFDTYMDSKGDTWLALHENLKRDKPHLAKLKDGTELKELEAKLGKRKSWSKVKVLSGPKKGAVGYLHAGWIRAVPRVTKGPKTGQEVMKLFPQNQEEYTMISLAEFEKLGLIDPKHGVNHVHLNPAGERDIDLPRIKRKVCGKKLKDVYTLFLEGDCIGTTCGARGPMHTNERYEFVERNGRLVLDTFIEGLGDEFKSGEGDDYLIMPDHYFEDARYIHKHRAKLSKKRCR